MSRNSAPRNPLEIDDVVRRAYEEILSESLPDRLSSLLETLKEGKLPDDTSKDGGEV